MRPSISFPFILFLIGALLLGSGQCDFVDVEILDGFGQVRLELGSLQKFECLASGEDLNGSFLWSIGGEDLSGVTTKDKYRDEEDMEFWLQKSIVRFTAQKKHHNKKLMCKYVNILEGGDRTEILNEDSLSLGVYFLEITNSVLLGHFQEGDDVRIDVEFTMFPRPQEGEVLWEMMENDGQKEVFAPGERSEYGLYSAEILKDLGQDRYKASFEIVSADLSENDREFNLVVGKENDESRGTGKRRVSLDFKILKKTPTTTVASTSSSFSDSFPSYDMEDSLLLYKIKSSTALPPPPRTFGSNTLSTTPETYTEDEITELRIGIISIIIMAFVVTIIIVLVSYCLFSRKKKEFTRVSTK